MFEGGWRRAHLLLDRIDRRFGAQLRRSVALERPWVAALDIVVAHQADRRFLTGAILPALVRERPRRLLFVGTRAYTAGYARRFAGSTTEFWTCDIDPAAAAHGAPDRHVTVDVRELRSAFPPGFFEVVLLNGIFGWGVDTRREMEQATAAIGAVLAPGGTLLIGWNSDRSPDPESLRGVAELFEPHRFSGLPQRTSFAEVTHVYAWYRRRTAPSGDPPARRVDAGPAG